MALYFLPCKTKNPTEFKRNIEKTIIKYYKQCREKYKETLYGASKDFSNGQHQFTENIKQAKLSKEYFIDVIKFISPHLNTEEKKHLLDTLNRMEKDRPFLKDYRQKKITNFIFNTDSWRQINNDLLKNDKGKEESKKFQSSHNK